MLQFIYLNVEKTTTVHNLKDDAVCVCISACIHGAREGKQREMKRKRKINFI